ncbi:mycofactocin biosynthesis FMN-dependent deaminase MftD [Saccharopolyspora halophila]|uniref:Mycofactocin biosynthesis FMN-dependent deaminase MftD n=1 Tax=Saccharopolyspora halophila TaxID=405551 RepID=A0ABN3G4Q1_9PSEU
MSQWFETVAEAHRRARKRLPKSVYKALVAGSERGSTLQDNIAAFGELGFAPHIAGLPAERDQSTTVLGRRLSSPVLISPTGVQAVHPDGEVAVARAAAEAGVGMGLSSFASRSIEDVIEANEETFFQMYWVGDRERVLARAERARKAGAKGLILTLDWCFAHSRDWGSPPIPEKMDLRTKLGFAPQGLLRPRWLYGFVRHGLPDLTTPNMVPPGAEAPTFFGAYGEWMFTPPPTWEDLAWLRERWDGPLAIKGITRPDDARRAVDVGADAISVSNHGGNNLDSTPASIRLLPAVVDAVGDQVEVLLDGGVRRGSDVVKALALGAKAVLIGRAYLWGLAAEGQAGVRNVLDIFRDGIDSGLMALGKSSVAELAPEDVIVPEGFTRTVPVA